ATWSFLSSGCSSPSGLCISCISARFFSVCERPARPKGNDEGQMTNDERNPKLEVRGGARLSPAAAATKQKDRPKIKRFTAIEAAAAGDSRAPLLIICLGVAS